MSIRRQLLPCLFLLATCTACVERRLWIRTEPPGATVRINGEEVGRTPVSWRFDHYGTVFVEAELDGHVPVAREFRLRTPWYQQPGIDFWADVVIPKRIHDDHRLKIVLKPEGRINVTREISDMSAAARKLRAEANQQ